MKIIIEHQQGTYPSFNVVLANGEKEPFLTIRGCKVVNGPKGRFVSGPSKKLDSGKYWNHLFMSEDFQAAILRTHDADAPAPAPAPRPNAYAQAKGRPQPAADDLDSDIPF